MLQRDDVTQADVSKLLFRSLAVDVHVEAGEEEVKVEDVDDHVTQVGVVRARAEVQLLALTGRSHHDDVY